MSLPRFFLFAFCILTCTAFAQKSTLNAKKAAQDIDYFIKLLENKHPDPKKAFPDYKRYRDSLVRTLPPNLDPNQFAALASGFAARFGDGDTYIEGPIFPSDSLNFPFAVELNQNEVRLKIENTSNPFHIYHNARIMGINGVEIQAFVESCLKEIPGETASYKQGILAITWAANVFKYFGRTHTVEIDHMGQTKVLQAPRLAAAPTPMAEKYILEMLDDSTAFMLIPNFKPERSSEYSAFLESAFNQLDAPYLIIDLRYNPGGNLQMSLELLDYIGKAEYPVFEKYNLRAKRKDKEILTNRLKSKLENLYDGEVYFLVNRTTYGEAAMLVNTAMQHNLAISIGEVMGQPYAGYCTRYTNVLPNSRLSFGISTAYYELVGTEKENRSLGIIPNLQTGGNALETAKGQIVRSYGMR